MMKHIIMVVILLFTYSTFAKDSANQNINQLVAYNVDTYPRDTYILLNQFGDLVHSADLTFQSINYFPINGVWQAMQEHFVPWQKHPIYVDLFFDHTGQQVYISDEDLIHQDLGENRLLKYSRQEKRYILVDKNHTVIKKLDPSIDEVVPYSSQRVLAFIKTEKYGRCFGYLDLNGNWAIQPIYNAALNHAYSFNGKYTVVERNIIDINDKMIPKRENETTRVPLSNRYWDITIKKDGKKYGDNYIINNKNEVIMDGVTAKALFNDFYLLSNTQNYHQKEGILNTKTGKIIPFKDNIAKIDNNLSDETFWVKIELNDDKSIHRLLDKNMQVLAKIDYSRIKMAYNNYAWVYSDESDAVVLVDIYGETLSKPYDRFVKTERYGDTYYSFAKTDEGKDILAADGRLVAKIKHVDGWDNEYCLDSTDLIYNANGDMVWPVNIEKNCFIKQKFSQIPESQKTEFIAAYMDAERKKNSRHSRFSSEEKYLSNGPATVDIKGVATLNLPEGYAYIASEYNFGCTGYIYSKKLSDINHTICLAIDDIGYINSGALNIIEASEAKLKDQIIKNNSDNYATSLNNQFTWLIAPKYDAGKRTLIWAYQLAQHQKVNEVPEFYYYDTASLIIFGQSKAIWLKNNNGQEADSVSQHITKFADLITFNPNEAYQENPEFTCNLLPNGDHTINEIDDFLPYSEKCFMYSPKILITGFSNKFLYYSSEFSQTKRFINNYSKPNIIKIN